MLTIRTLGAFNIKFEGGVLARWTGLRPKLLLLYLAEQGEPQSRNDLAELFWPAVKKPLAHNSLRVLLSRLRSEGPPLILHITRNMVSIASSLPVDYDVRQIRNIASNLNHADEATLRQAADLYNGSFLSTVSLGKHPVLNTWVVSIRAELDALMVRILRRLLALMLQSCSDPGAAVGYARKLVELAPYNDQIQGIYIQALAANGQLAQALQHFGSYQRSLPDGHRAGHELVALVTHLSQPENAARLATTLEDSPIPMPLSHNGIEPDKKMNFNMNFYGLEYLLVGRQREVALLLSLLADGHRLISITAMGGAGKSVFVRSQIDTLRALFGSRLYFVDLRRVEAPAGLSEDARLRAIVTAFGLIPQPGQPSFNQVVEPLIDAPCCLILDNLDDVQSAPQVVSALLQAAPQLTLIITGRQRLQLHSSVYIHLDGLSAGVNASDEITPDEITPDKNGITSAPLSDVNERAVAPALPLASEAAAVHLFALCAQRRQPAFTVDDSNRALIGRICHYLGGLPLAIDLAARQLDFYSLEDLVEALPRDNSLLRDEEGILPPEHQSIQKILETMWQTVDAQSQRVLAELSIFATTWHREAMLAVVPAPRTVYTALINASLLQVHEPGWFSLHPLVKQYAAAELCQSNNSAEVEHRHALYFLGLLDKSEPQLAQSHPDSSHLFQMLQAQYADIYAAWRRTMQTPAWKLGRDRYHLLDLLHPNGATESKRSTSAQEKGPSTPPHRGADAGRAA
jgi:predicted ATPase/DNA-binding SARP family transcriptional activator